MSSFRAMRCPAMYEMSGDVVSSMGVESSSLRALLCILAGATADPNPRQHAEVTPVTEVEGCR